MPDTTTVTTHLIASAQPPSLLGGLKSALPALVSRKMVVALSTKASILAIAWLATRGIDHDIAIRLIEFVVPALTATGLGHMASQGWVDKTEAQGDVAAEERAAIEAAFAAQPPAPKVAA